MAVSHRGRFYAVRTGSTTWDRDPLPAFENFSQLSFPPFREAAKLEFGNCSPECNVSRATVVRNAFMRTALADPVSANKVSLFIIMARREGDVWVGGTRWNIAIYRRSSCPHRTHPLRGNWTVIRKYSQSDRCQRQWFVEIAAKWVPGNKRRLLFSLSVICATRCWLVKHDELFSNVHSGLAICAGDLNLFIIVKYRVLETTKSDFPGEGEWRFAIAEPRFHEREKKRGKKRKSCERKHFW